MCLSKSINNFQLGERSPISLKTIENAISFIIWTVSILQAGYAFFCLSNTFFEHYDDPYEDFKIGWLFQHRKRDCADLEWEAFVQVFLRSIAWIVLLLVGSEFCRKWNLPLIHQTWQIFLSTFFLIYEVGVIGAATVLIVLLLYECASKIHSQFVIWGCTIALLILLGFFESFSLRDVILEDLGLSLYQYYLVLSVVHWIMLKCTSYFSDVFKCEISHNFVQLSAYCMYLPLLFYGPFIRFNDFKNIYHNDLNQSLKARITQLTLKLLRFSFWFLFVEVTLHFLYVNAASFQPQFVKTLPPLALYGYGYSMGQYFHVKYVVFYGFATSYAGFENVPVPDVPRCIAWIHLYSDMWRYFDPGLYTFLTRYIYFPTMKSRLTGNKIISSFICFSFVFLWHGMHTYILMWAVLNFVGLFLETIFKQYIGVFKTDRLCQETKRRLAALLAAPLLAMSALSNFYFFAGQEIGDVFVRKFLQSDVFTNSLLLFCLFNCCQVSVVFKEGVKKKNSVKVN